MRETFVVFGDPIGAGGQGAVYKAVQTSLRRIVALKRPEGRLAGPTATPTEDTRRSMTFFQEALTIALLDHPNIVQVYDIGEDASGNPYLAMKLVRGRVWSDVLSEEARSLPATEFLARHIPILLSVAQAVAFAHSRGVVHRDLNPTQIMVGEFGEVYVMDWGLAVSWRPDLLDASKNEIADALGMTPDAIANYAAPPLDRASAPAGTRAWMAPEQTLPTALEVGPWTDTYLLGGMLYHLLTLTVPHPRNADTGERTSGPVDRASVRAPHRPVPRDLEELCSRAMAHRPADRLPDVREFVRELQAHLTGSHRRSEASRLVDAAKGRVGALDEASYEGLSAVERDLTRAIELDPDHAEAASLRDAVRTRQATAALTHGDLVLAKSVASQLPEAHPESIRLKGQIAEAVARRARQSRIQRVAVASTVALLILASGLAAFAGISSSRAAGESARALLAARDKQAAEDTANLLRRIDRQRREEGELARDYALNFPMPDGNRRMATSPAELDAPRLELVAGRAALREDRLALEREHPESRELLGLEPFEFVIGEANDVLERAETKEQFLAAYAAYLRARDLRPEAESDTETGLGLAASRAGFGTSATIHLSRAREAVGLRVGPNHPDFARAVERLASAYRENRDAPESYQKYYAESLALQEDRWIESTQGILRSWTALEESAIPSEYAATLLSVAERRHGRESIEAARALWMLARSKRLAGKHTEAWKDYREAVELLERHQPPTSSDAYTAMLEVAELLSSFAKFNDAYEYLDRAMKGIERVYGPESREMFLARRSLALVYLDDAKQISGRSIMEAVLEGQQALLGPMHPETLETESILLAALARMANQDELDELDARVEDMIARLEGRLGEKHPLAVGALSARARMHDRRERAEDSVRTLLEQRARYLRGHPEGHPLVEKCDWRLVQVLSLAKKPSEAWVPLQRLKAAAEANPEDLARRWRHLRAQVFFWCDGMGRSEESVYYLALIQKDRISIGECCSEATLNSLGTLLQMGRPLFRHQERMTILRRQIQMQELSPSDNEFDRQHIWFGLVWELERSVPASSRERLHATARVVRRLEDLFRGSGVEKRTHVAMIRGITYATTLGQLLVLVDQHHPERREEVLRAAEWMLAFTKAIDPEDRGRRTAEAARHQLAGVESSLLRLGLPELPLFQEDWRRMLPPEAQSQVTMAEIMAATDRAAPPIDWERMFPEIEDWSMAPICGDPAELEAEFHDLLDRLIASGEPGPPNFEGWD